MRGRPGCLLQSAGGKANRILLASTLSSMRIICPNRVSRREPGCQLVYLLGGVLDRESLPVRDRRSTAVPRHQLRRICCVCRRVRHLDVDLQLVSSSLKSLEVTEQMVCAHRFIELGGGYTQWRSFSLCLFVC